MALAGERAGPSARERRVGVLVLLAAAAFIARMTLLPAAQAPLPRGFCLVCGMYGVVDTVLNVILFAPLGFGLWLSGVRARRAALICLAATVTIETLQRGVIAGRDASLGDVLTNTLGGLIGVLLARHWRTLVFPRPGGAARLAAGAAALWAAVLLGSGWWAQRAIPPHAGWAQIAPRVAGFDPFPGRVLAASAGGRRLGAAWVPTGATDPDDDAAVALAAAVVGGGRETPQMSVIVRINQPGLNEVALLGQHRDAVVYRTRRRTRDERVRTPSVRLDGVFPSGSTDSVRIAGGVRGGTMYVEAERGGVVRRATVDVGPAVGWSYWLPFDYAFGPERPWLTALWLGGLLAPAGYWLGRASRGRGAGAAAASVALSLVVGLMLAPLLFRLPMAAASDWAAAVAGGLAFAAVGRLASRRERVGRP